MTLLALQTKYEEVRMLVLIRETAGHRTSVLAIKEDEFPKIIEEAVRLGWAIKVD